MHVSHTREFMGTSQVIDLRVRLCLRRLAIFMCLAVSLWAQQPDFDFAYIKLDPNWPPMTVGPGFEAHGVGGSKVTLRNLVMFAYDVTAPRVIGPAWLDSNRFDIAARAPEGTAPADLRVMVQNLLKQRFHLQAHMETREMPVYDMVIAKNGVKMVRHPAPHACGAGGAQGCLSWSDTPLNATRKRANNNLHRREALRHD